jgi:hypothetical protein
MPTRRSGALFHAITRSTRAFKSTLAPYDTHQQPYTPHQLQPQLHLGYMPNRPTRAAAAIQCSSVVCWVHTWYAWPLQCTPALWCAAQALAQYPNNATNSCNRTTSTHVPNHAIVGTVPVQCFRTTYEMYTRHTIALRSTLATYCSPMVPHHTPCWWPYSINFAVHYAR